MKIQAFEEVVLGSPPYARSLGEGGPFLAEMSVCLYFLPQQVPLSRDVPSGARSRVAGPFLPSQPQPVPCPESLSRSLARSLAQCLSSASSDPAPASEARETSLTTSTATPHLWERTASTRDGR